MRHRCFKEVAGKEFPGNLALSRLTAELYHTLVLLDKYASSQDSQLREEIEKALSALDTHKTTHALFDKNNDNLLEIELLVQDFSRLVTQYLLAIQRHTGKQYTDSIHKKLDLLLNTFFNTINPYI